MPSAFEQADGKPTGNCLACRVQATDGVIEPPPPPKRRPLIVSAATLDVPPPPPVAIPPGAQAVIDAVRLQAEQEEAATAFKVEQELERSEQVLEAAAMAEAEAARRILARRRLLAFTQRIQPDYQAGWFHKHLCERLEKFVEDVVAKKSPRLILAVPPRHGKLVSHDTPVRTPGGWRTHGELAPGDWVYHPAGHPVRVVAVSDEQPADVRVEITNGDVIYCHENHEWTVFDRSAKAYRTVDTAYLMRRQLQSGGRCLLQLPPTRAFEAPHADLPVDPYTLGAWLGDGYSKRPALALAAGDMAVAERIAAAGHPVTSTHTHPDTGVVTVSFAEGRAGGRGKPSALARALKKAGVLGAKHIPEAYVRASVAQRLELLAGLVDTDGHVCRKTGRVRVVTTSDGIADGVEAVAASLGWRPYRSVQPAAVASSGIAGRLPVITVGFQPTRPLPCALPRKRPPRIAPQRRHAIARAVHDPQGKRGRCIQVDSPDGLYVVGAHDTPTHNSQLVSINLPAWALGRYPWMEFIAASHTTSLALGFSRKVRNIVDSSGYKALYRNTRLAKDSQAAEHWMTTDGGGYVAAGVGSAIVGKGCHILSIDDPVAGADDAENQNNRERIIEWYQTEARTRLAPGGGVLIIMQRWHDSDLAGWLETQGKRGEGEEWEVIKFPAIAEDDEPYRRKGEALHPERYPVEMLEMIRKGLTPRQWAALYQQNPVPDEGAYFTRRMFRYYETMPAREDLTFYDVWDFAIGQNEHNDYTVGATFALDRDDNLYLVDLQRGRWDSLEIAQRIIDTHLRWQSSYVGAEKGHIQMALGPLIEKMLREQKVYTLSVGGNLIPLLPGRRDKRTRARTIQGRMEQGRVLLPRHAPWLPVVEAELLRFDSGEHDDIVDVFAWIGLMLNDLLPAQAPKVEVKASWRDRVARYASSRSKSAMTA